MRKLTTRTDVVTDAAYPEKRIGDNLTNVNEELLGDITQFFFNTLLNQYRIDTDSPFFFPNGLPDNNSNGYEIDLLMKSYIKYRVLYPEWTAITEAEFAADWSGEAYYRMDRQGDLEVYVKYITFAAVGGPFTQRTAFTLPFPGYNDSIQCVVPSLGSADSNLASYDGSTRAFKINIGGTTYTANSGPYLIKIPISV